MSRPGWKDLSLKEVKKKIRLIRQVDLRVENINYLLERRLSPLLKGFPFVNMELESKDVEFIYRARAVLQENVEMMDNGIRHKPFCHIKELWYPPAEEVKKLGRINRENTPVYYCSNIPAVAYVEMRPTNGKVLRF